MQIKLFRNNHNTVLIFNDPTYFSDLIANLFGIDLILYFTSQLYNVAHIDTTYQTQESVRLRNGHPSR